MQRARSRTYRKRGVGRIGAFPRMLRRPLRISHELGAEKLVISDRLLDESARLELAVAKQTRDLGHRKRERARHRYLVLSDPFDTEDQRERIAVRLLS